MPALTPRPRVGFRRGPWPERGVEADWRFVPEYVSLRRLPTQDVMMRERWQDLYTVMNTIAQLAEGEDMSARAMAAKGFELMHDRIRAAEAAGEHIQEFHNAEAERLSAGDRAASAWRSRVTGWKFKAFCRGRARRAGRRPPVETAAPASQGAATLEVVWRRRSFSAPVPVQGQEVATPPLWSVVPAGARAALTRMGCGPDRFGGLVANLIPPVNDLLAPVQTVIRIEVSDEKVRATTLAVQAIAAPPAR